MDYSDIEQLIAARKSLSAAELSRVFGAEKVAKMDAAIAGYEAATHRAGEEIADKAAAHLKSDT
jgi:hypothetical protein